MTDKLLAEGGLGGHMPHLYENGDLTFGEIKDVFKQASKGQLKGTEKTDGQNIKLSFNVKTQKALGARNTTQIKSGGLSIEEMYGFFANHKNPKLKYTFSDAVKIFEKAVKLLDVNTQIEIFGPEANNWYNAEVMDDRSPNVVNYDARNLLIHRTGHMSYDKKSGKEIQNSDIDKKADKFMGFLSKVQNSVSNKRHAILVNPIQNLKELDNKEALRVAFYKLEHTISKYDLKDDNTINDFLKAELNAKIKTNIPDELKDSVINSTLGIIPKINKRELKKQITPELYNELNSLIDSIPLQIKTAIKPIELIVTDFAAEMLKTLESIFILDNKAETARLAKEVEVAINKIQSSENKGDIDFLNAQLEKLKDTQSISSAVEGFAFSYKGIIYKFTGKFAPVNQILGLSKYGRSKKGATELDEQQSSVRTFDTALLGGGFKPPHKGHIELIKQLASKADNVIIYTSDKSSKERTFKSGELKGQVIDGKKCNDLLQKMIAAIPELKNVNLIVTNTPLKEIFDYVEKTSKFGESILIGVGDKEEDAKRFDNISKYIPPEKKLKVEILPLKAVVFDGEPLSASRLREAISNRNVDRVASFIPNEIFNKTQFAQKMISMFTGKPEKSFTEEVFEEVMDIFTNENKLDEMSAMGAGAVTGHVASNKGRKKMKIDRKTFMEELELRKAIRKALILREEKKKQKLSEEQQLRQFIRQLIKEAKEEVTNFDNTGLNFLAEFFRDSLKQMEVGFKSLKTNQQQRDSFKAHIIKNLEALVKRESEQMKSGDDMVANTGSDLEEEINLSIDEPVDDKILDLGLDKKSKKADKDSYQFERMSDHEQTGAERAEEVFDQIKDNALEQIRKLHDPEDRSKFIEYLTPNLVSWMDQWNASLGKQQEPTPQTPEGAQTTTPPDQGTV